MNAQKVCAPSNGALGKEIKIHKANVKRLQMRIVKAQKQRKHNKVKALQWILTHSYSARKALKKMWSKQKRQCTLCGDEINMTSGWRLHISDKNSKEMVHPECHRKIHPELLITAPVETRQR